MYLDVLIGHYLLWKGNDKYRVEHTDISAANFGVDPLTLNVKIRDFDLARLVRVNEPNGPRSTERTGTTPFMAIELLKKGYWEGDIGRLYRHDLEGFVWVVAYYAWVYDDAGIEVDNSPVRTWFTADYEQCAKEKTYFLSELKDMYPDHRLQIANVWYYTLGLLRWLKRVRRQLEGEKDIEGEAEAEAEAEAQSLVNEGDQPATAAMSDPKSAFEKFWEDIERFRVKADAVKLTPDVVKSFMSRKADMAARRDGRSAVGNGESQAD
ncbi:hypothetical protein DAEQUDRAFT_520705 [Daedalea quercina L-15889]|uniref:Protein kinase domain-containing protein n=1 Tax=Daedalea quercina L-15889 TaxID=1314783 RepID=A0A165MCJ6_9APHY|nr:hypothetical protein DAEQUDRAFT_520705 [Daedalea quercina L-15889]